MKYKKEIRFLVILIVVLSTVACLVGLVYNKGVGSYEFKSINGELIEIYGKGIYKNDSVSVVAQGKASDLVTLVLGVPLLLSSLLFAIKGSFRARLLLTGTLGYFLYTYMSYVFLWMYNPLFLVYVILMSASMFAFIMSMMFFDVERIPKMFKNGLPIRFLAGFQFFIAFMIGMLWLGKIIPSIFSGKVPAGLEHYSTLVIQGMDLGFVIPVAILSGVLILKKRPFGYLLTSIVILKGFTMLTCISAMIINMVISGVEVSVGELVIFPAFNLLAIISMVILFRNVCDVSE